MLKIQKQKLAFYGGKKVRNKPMPARLAFGTSELQAIKDVFAYYRRMKQDFGYQGEFERLYTERFVRYMAVKGFADAVSTGTLALYVSIASLQIKPGSHVLVSPVTDPGTVNAIILNRLVPVIVDAVFDSYNTGVEEIRSRITDKTRAVMVVHIGGKPAPIKEIIAFAQDHNLAVIEDCSQAHGASIDGKKLGTFGKIGVFSTMYRKAHASGGCGGVIFTKDKKTYELVRAYSDRGKPFFKNNFNEKDPSGFLFPALNANIDEISCAIGLQSLLKLEETRRKRIIFLQNLGVLINKYSKLCRMSPVSVDDSPFFQTVSVDTAKISCSKVEFACALAAEGIDVNPDYRYVACEWKWLRPYLYDNFVCKNAINYRKNTFNLLLNEHYGKTEVEDIIDAILKVEQFYLK